MSLSAAKAAYAAALKAADLAAKAVTDPANFESAITAKTNAYADAAETFIKSADVLPSGTPIPLTSPPGTDGGPVTGTGVLL